MRAIIMLCMSALYAPTVIYVQLFPAINNLFCCGNHRKKHRLTDVKASFENVKHGYLQDERSCFMLSPAEFALTNGSKGVFIILFLVS